MIVKGGLHNLLQLTDESRDLSQAEKKITEFEAEEIHEMTIIFTQNGQKLPFLVKIIVIFSICSSLKVSYFQGTF